MIAVQFDDATFVNAGVLRVGDGLFIFCRVTLGGLKLPSRRARSSARLRSSANRRK